MQEGSGGDGTVDMGFIPTKVPKVPQDFSQALIWIGFQAVS